MGPEHATPNSFITTITVVPRPLGRWRVEEGRWGEGVCFLPHPARLHQEPPSPGVNYFIDLFPGSREGPTRWSQGGEEGDPPGSQVFIILFLLCQ